MGNLFEKEMESSNATMLVAENIMKVLNNGLAQSKKNEIQLTPNIIDSDSQTVKLLVKSAKFGQWSTVFEILEKKSYLINCIPEDRRWSVLHQAVWFKNEKVIKRLMNIKGCDTYVQTKSGATEGKGYETPADIAKIKEYDMKINLSDCSSLQEFQMPSFFSEETGLGYRSNGPPLMLITILCYKETFHPLKINDGTTFLHLMKNIFENIDFASNWTTARGKLKESFYSLDRDHREKLLKASNKLSFYQSVLHIYTTESYNIYRDANKSLRKQERENFVPTGLELSLGPYIVMLQAILLYWNGIKKYTQTTYRCVSMHQDQFDEYKIGTVLCWPAFVSTSYDINVAKKFGGEQKELDLIQVFFEIDNSRNSLWQPKLVEELAEWKKEKEAMYPAGALFEVILQDRVTFTIKLKLLP